jgi:hypothetical protein
MKVCKVSVGDSGVGSFLSTPSFLYTYPSQLPEGLIQWVHLRPKYRGTLVVSRAE